MSEKKQMIVRLPMELYEDLRVLAAIRGASINETVIRLLREGLEVE